MCKYVILFLHKNPDILSNIGKLMSIDKFTYKPFCFDNLEDIYNKISELKEDYNFSEYNFEIFKIDNCDGC
jgi:hypothetical protein